jgi:predicted methyltransferase
MGSPLAFSSEFQQAHRRALVSFWDIKPGSRVLELGGGQGDCTIVLAEAVGETGHVDAVDPGAADYGAFDFNFFPSPALAHHPVPPSIFYMVPQG